MQIEAIRKTELPERWISKLRVTSCKLRWNSEVWIIFVGTASYQESQLLHTVWTWKLHQWCPVTEEADWWHHDFCHVSDVNLTDQKQNGDQMPNFKLDDYCWVQTLSDIYIKMIKNVINDVIMTITWPGYNLQTGYKVRTRFNISGSPSAIVYKLSQIC